jgi:hypothetical protein
MRQVKQFQFKKNVNNFGANSSEGRNKKEIGKNINEKLQNIGN